MKTRRHRVFLVPLRTPERLLGGVAVLLWVFGLTLLPVLPAAAAQGEEPATVDLIPLEPGAGGAPDQSVSEISDLATQSDSAGLLPVGGPEVPISGEEEAAVPVPSARYGARVEAIEFQQRNNSSDVVVRLTGKATHTVVKLDERRVVLNLPGSEIPSHLRRHVDTSAFPSSVLTVFPEQHGSGPAGLARVVIVLREPKPYEVLEEDDLIRVSFQLPDKPPVVTPLPAPQVPASGEGLIQKSEVPVTPAAEVLATREAAAALKAEQSESDSEAVSAGELAGESDVPPQPTAEVSVSSDTVPGKVEVNASQLAETSGGEGLLPSGIKVTTTGTLPGGSEMYRGSRMSLDFKDADIQNVLRLIAEVSGKNIVISDAVQGKVTIRLMNVPWDLALDVILKTYALDKEELAPGILRVAPYTQLKTERDEALKARQALQQVEMLVTEVVTVNYAKAERIQPMLEKLKSGRADASILVDSRTNALVLKDLPKTIAEMTKLIRELDLQTPQVLIEAKIVELDVGFERELGVQWGMMYRAGPATGNPTGMNFPGTASVGGAYSNISGETVPGIANPVVNLPAAVSNTAGGALGLSLASITDSLKLDLQLSALEQDNHARVLSSPRVATLNNQEARIEQGQEVPFQTTSDEGTKTEFKDAMLRLTVTPQINFDKSIIMKIVVSNDTPIPDQKVDYIIQKKEAETTVLVNDSETAVIGGIYTTADSKTKGGIPWFMDIPGVGSLFQKQFREDKRTELIIFITPRIVPTTQARAGDWVQ